MVLTIVISTIVVTSIMYIIEVGHDSILSQIMTYITNVEDRRELSREWHRWDFMFHVMYATLITSNLIVTTGDLKFLFMLPIIGSLRMIILNIGMNLKLRPKDGLFHLGQNPIDKFLNATLGHFWPILPVVIVGVSAFLILYL